MSDFYINDSEYCLVDEYFYSLPEKISDFKNDNIEFHQCFLDDEVRSKELTKALSQVESSEEFAFYNLGLSKKEQEILSNIEKAYLFSFILVNRAYMITWYPGHYSSRCKVPSSKLLLDITLNWLHLGCLLTFRIS